GDIVVLPFAGGRAAGLDVGVGGVPTLQAGASYVIFLDQTPARPVPAIGWGNGIFRVGERPIEKISSLDGEDLEIDEENELVRVRPTVEKRSDPSRLASPVALNADGSVAPPLPERQQVRRVAAHRTATIDDLRRFVRGEIP